MFKAFARALRFACSRDRRLQDSPPFNQGTVCDGRAPRLRRRQSCVRPKGAARLWASIIGRRHAPMISIAREGLLSPASATSRRPPRSGTNGVRQFSREFERECRYWGSVWACSGCSRGVLRRLRYAGLGVFEGRCTRLEAQPPLKVPHVGWNTLSACRESTLLQHVPQDAHVYFTHTFAAPVTAECVATATHGGSLPAAVERDHIWGVQFHPEKSAAHGLQVLRNFARMVNA